MSMNGAMIGMAITKMKHKPIHQGHILTLAAYAVAVAGDTMQSTVGHRFAATKLLTSDATALVSVSHFAYKFISHKFNLAIMK